MNVLINDIPFNRIGQNCVDTSVKFLGICIDEHPTWKSHIQQVNCKISKAMFAIKQVTNLLPGSLLALDGWEVYRDAGLSSVMDHSYPLIE